MHNDFFLFKTHKNAEKSLMKTDIVLTYIVL